VLFWLVPGIAWLFCLIRTKQRPHLAALGLLPLPLAGIAACAGLVNLIRAFPPVGPNRDSLVSGAIPVLALTVSWGAVLTFVSVFVVAVLTVRRSGSWSLRRSVGRTALVAFLAVLALQSGLLALGLGVVRHLSFESLSPSWPNAISGGIWLSFALCALVLSSAVKVSGVRVA